MELVKANYNLLCDLARVLGSAPPPLELQPGEMQKHIHHSLISWYRARNMIFRVARCLWCALLISSLAFGVEGRNNFMGARLQCKRSSLRDIRVHALICIAALTRPLFRSRMQLMASEINYLLFLELMLHNYIYMECILMRTLLAHQLEWK